MAATNSNDITLLLESPIERLTLTDLELLILGLKERPALLRRANERFPFDVLSGLRSSLSPNVNDPEMQKLIARFHETDSNDRESRMTISSAVMKLNNELDNTPAGHEHARIFDDLTKLLSSSLKNATDGSNRANRARMASDVFNQHAGQVKIDGARDAHGNAMHGDLAKNNAFKGLVITILNFNHENNSILPVARIAEELGFTVKVKDFNNTSSNYYTKNFNDLNELLANTSQCWIISGTGGTARVEISYMQIDIIIRHYQDGMGLYVLGDNEPFYHDANRMLNELFHRSGVEMTGNYPGEQIVGLDSTKVEVLHPQGHKPRGGYILEDNITTGCEKVYNGNTVANIANTKLIPGFVPVMYESPGVLVLGYLPADEKRGPLILSGAFTTFYHELDRPGSTRLIKNCIAFLSTKIETTPQVPSQPDTYDMTNAFVDECDISYVEGPVCLIANKICRNDSDGKLPNCSDFVINNPLSYDPKNMAILGRQIYDLTVAQQLLSRGEDPFRRTPAIAMIPLVDLSNPQNFRLITHTLCNIFMGGKYMPFVSWMVFLSVCEKMQSSDSEHPEAWSYLVNQIMTNVKSTIDMSESGIRMPLRDAILAFLKANNDIDLRPYTKSFAQTITMVRLVKPDNSDAIIRRATIKNIMSFLRSKVMQDVDITVHRCEELLFDMQLQVKIHNTGHLTTHQKCIDAHLVPALLEGQHYLTDGMITSLLNVFLRNVNAFVANRIDNLIDCLLRHSKILLELWNGVDAPENKIIKRLNSRFVQNINDRHNKGTFVPFVTCLGPSVLRCQCGFSFLVNGEGTTADEARQARTCHFQEVYNSDTQGKPQRDSSHTSYHVNIRRMLTEAGSPFAQATEWNMDMSLCVARILSNKRVGHYNSSEMESDIRNIIESYLELRRAGANEYRDISRPTFALKMQVEMGLIP